MENAPPAPASTGSCRDAPVLLAGPCGSCCSAPTLGPFAVAFRCCASALARPPMRAPPSIPFSPPFSPSRSFLLSPFLSLFSFLSVPARGCFLPPRRVLRLSLYLPPLCRSFASLFSFFLSSAIFLFSLLLTPPSRLSSSLPSSLSILPLCAPSSFFLFQTPSFLCSLFSSYSLLSFSLPFRSFGLFVRSAMVEHAPDPAPGNVDGRAVRGRGGCLAHCSSTCPSAGPQHADYASHHRRPSPLVQPSFSIPPAFCPMPLAPTGFFQTLGYII